MVAPDDALRWRFARRSDRSGRPGPGHPGPRSLEHPHRPLRRRFFLFLSIAGPGLIAANAGNDAGGIATYASAGSQYVYRPLFFMVLVTVGLVVVQEMSARLGAYTGKGLAALIREEFSVRLTSLAVVSLLIANTGLVVSEFAGIGAALQLFGIPRLVTVPLAAAAIWASSSSGPTGTRSGSSSSSPSRSWRTRSPSPSATPTGRPSRATPSCPTSSSTRASSCSGWR